MGIDNFPLLCFDCRANSCPLDEEWHRRAREAIRHRKVLAHLIKKQLQWKYDASDCECIKYLGEDKHDPRNECRYCGQCIADEPMLGNSWDTADDKPACISCVMTLENVGIEEIAGLF